MSGVKDLLSEIHQLSIERLYQPDLPTNERIADIKLTRQKLRVVKKDLREKQKDTKQSWDARQGKVHKIMQNFQLAPFELIDDLIEQIEISLKELENATEFDRPLPPPPIIGEIAFPEIRPTAILTRDEALLRAKLVNDDIMEKNKSEAKAIQSQIEMLSQELDNTKGLFSKGRRDELQEKIVTLKEELLRCKKTYLSSKFLAELQLAVQEPLCIGHSTYYGYHKQFETKEELESELIRVKHSLKHLHTLREQLKQTASITEDFVPLTEDIISQHEEVMAKIEKYLIEIQGS